MSATTESAQEATAEADHRWLGRQAPGWLIPATAALAILEASTLIAQAGLLAWIADGALIRQLPPPDWLPALWALAAVLVVRAALGGLAPVLSARASARARGKLRQNMLERIGRAGPAAVASQGSGRLAAVWIEHVEALDGYFSRFLPQSIAVAIIPVLLLVAVFWLDWMAGLILLISAPLIPLFLILIGLRAEQLSQHHHRVLARIGDYFLDRLRGLDTLRGLSAQSAELVRLDKIAGRFRQSAMQVLRVAFLSSAVLEFFAAVAIAVLAIYIGLGLMNMLQIGPAGQLNLFTGLFILLLAPEFFRPLRELSQGWHDRASAIGAAAEIRQVLALPPARTHIRPRLPKLPADLPRACGVTLDGVCFGYSDRRRLFDRIDLEVPAGQRLLLVGPSGAGKSTLLHLVAGHLEPETGQIRLGEHTIDRLADPELTAHIGWLSQRPVLMAGSIADNLRLGRPDAHSGEIERAAARAGVDEFASRLPSGLDSLIGEGGHGLSGGQIQRIALARVLIDPKPVLLLDEPTANLDPNSERHIIATLADNLDEMGCTVICASHRPAFRDWADRIIEVNSGQLSETAR